VDRQVVAMGLSLDPIIEVYGIRPPEGGLFSRCAGLTSTTASKRSESLLISGTWHATLTS
jgi:hypothetical protein